MQIRKPLEFRQGGRRLRRFPEVEAASGAREAYPYTWLVIDDSCVEFADLKGARYRPVGC